MGEIRLYAESLANRVFPAIVLLEKEGDANRIILGRYAFFHTRSLFFTLLHNDLIGGIVAAYYYLCCIPPRDLCQFVRNASRRQYS